MQEPKAILEEKAALRREMVARRDAIERPLRLMAAHAALGDPHWSELGRFLPPKGATIATYVAMRSEFDPGLLMMRVTSLGYHIACPRVTPEGLAFHLVTSAAELVPGPFGTREPSAEAPQAEPSLILTPLLAFDRFGNRLGYGKGYYDRAFARWPAARRVGLAFAEQEVTAVPHGQSDVPLEHVIAVPTAARR